MLNNNLKSIRMREYEMSSSEFAKFLGVSYTTYSNWEIGVSKPTLEKAFEVANKLSKKVEDII